MGEVWSLSRRSGCVGWWRLPTAAISTSLFTTWTFSDLIFSHAGSHMTLTQDGFPEECRVSIPTKVEGSTVCEGRGDSGLLHCDPDWLTFRPNSTTPPSPPADLGVTNYHYREGGEEPLDHSLKKCCLFQGGCNKAIWGQELCFSFRCHVLQVMVAPDRCG